MYCHEDIEGLRKCLRRVYLLESAMGQIVPMTFVAIAAFQATPGWSQVIPLEWRT